MGKELKNIYLEKLREKCIKLGKNVPSEMENDIDQNTSILNNGLEKELIFFIKLQNFTEPHSQIKITLL